MYHLKSLRSNTCLILAAAALVLLLLQLGGCSDNDANPMANQQSEPPTMPSAEMLTFDFSFFDSAEDLDKSIHSHQNFLNAYLRTVILEAMAHLVLAPPVAAFSAAVHTVPVAQPDGSWLWTYRWDAPQGSILVILRGTPADQVVEWELSLAPGKEGPQDLWFSGTTNGDGSEGHWTFYDLDDPKHPVSGEIAWGESGSSNYLEFVSREPGEDGNTLRFTDDDPHFRIDYLPGDDSTPSFIRWEANGSGSLMVPDYNGGLEACWDTYLQDVDCH
jgi:hypothetical protein